MNKNIMSLTSVSAMLLMSISASATVVRLDMGTEPTENGFVAQGLKLEDIASVPGKLTMDIPAGAANGFSIDIDDGLGSGSVISFGANIKFDVISNRPWDRYIYWGGFDDKARVKYTVRLLMRATKGGEPCMTTVQYAGEGEQLLRTAFIDGQEHTFRVDIDKASGLGTFYFDGVEKGTPFQTAESAKTGSNTFHFGDGTPGKDEEDGEHKEYWDDVFFSNEGVSGPGSIAK